MDDDVGVKKESDGNNLDEKWLKQNQERQEYMKKLKKWLDDARLWHYNFCARIPSNSIPSSSSNIAENVLQQYASLAQTNLLHQHFQNFLLNSNNFNRNNQSTGFNTSELILE